MINRTQKLRLGIFVSFATIVLVGTLISLTGSRFTQKRDEYIIRLSTSVSGLDIGSPVKYNGVQVGRVESISVDPKNVSDILVRISVTKGTPIKEDTRAVATTLGITGLKYIELVKSTDSSPFLSPGSEIPEEISFVDNLTGKATAIALKTEQILNNLVELTDESNRQKLSSIFARFDHILSEFDKLITEVRPSLVGLSENLAQSASSLDQTLKNFEGILKDNRPTIKETLNSANELISSLKEEQKNLKSVLVNANSAIANAKLILQESNLKETLANTNRMISEINITILKNRENLTSTLEYMNQASENLKDFSRLILENPSALFLGVKEEERKLP